VETDLKSSKVARSNDGWIQSDKKGKQ